MTWFKVDDSFYDHPKVFDAPDCAVALWTRAGCWSARNLTDGFVPASLPARLCGDPDIAVRELVNRGLWKRAKGGYQFHDWLDRNPSRKDVEQQRAKRAEAGRKGGLASGKARSKPGSKREANASEVVEPPARPGPPPFQRKGGPGGATLRSAQRPPLRAVRDWCGRCNKDTRMDVGDDDRSRPCPICHPAAEAS